ncbi:MAG: ATP-binding protein [Pseudanabaenaceae cyanobacterium bins.68]|nr:ATP-binding protein [Pseudanabaenaceae cyanobacterium bins.68]
MINFFKKSLLLQLVTYFSFLSLVTVVLVALSAYFRARDSLTKSVYDRLSVATSLKDFQVNEWLDNQRRDVLLISKTPSLQANIEVLLAAKANTPAYTQNLKELGKYLTEVASTKPSISQILVLSGSGIVLYSRNPEDIGKYQPLGNTTTYFTRTSGVVKPTFYTSTLRGEPEITFATPILNPKGARIAVIAMNLDLEGVDRIIRERTGLGDSGETYLVGSLESKNAFISGDQETIAKFPDGVNSPGIDAAMRGRSGTGLYLNYRQVPVIGTYNWSSKQNLALMAEMSQAEAFEPANRLAREILLIGLSSAGILMTVVYLIARRITQPILAIADTAINVSEGNLNAIAPVMTEDEIGVLAQAFNQMTSQIKQSGEQLADYSRTLEQKVNQRTSEIKAIIDNMVDGLVVIDAEDKISQSNRALLNMMKLEAEQVIGHNFRQVFDTADIDNLIISTRKCAKQAFSAEFSLPNQGTGKAVATSIFRYGEDSKQDDHHSGDTDFSGYVGSVILIRDITVEKEVDRMKTEFVSSVSHELRTPLTSVLGFAKLIQKKLEETIFPLVPQDEKKIQRTVRQVTENIEIIVSEGTRLTKLINEVLDIAKMEAGKIDWKMEPTSIQDVIERAMAATSALFEQKGLEAIKQIQPNLPIINADQDRLIQVVINLISNAVKFQSTGSVTCTAELVRDQIRVCVIDQGIGIAPEDLPKVFEKFKQVGDTLTKKPQGTGLGLPISKEIVEHHGGEIGLESEVGKGTTFYFTLPLQPPAET